MRVRTSLLISAALFAAGCGYPDFAFRSGKSHSSADSSSSTSVTSGTGGGGSSTASSGGTGGMGGSGGQGGADAATTTTTTTTTSATTSTGSGLSQVPCAGGVCDPSEICCFHNTTFSCDACGTSGACTNPDGPDCGGSRNFTELKCNGSDDCPPGKTCCISLSLINEGLISSSECTQDFLCFADLLQYPACEQSACPDGGTCTSAGYAGYEYCK